MATMVRSILLTLAWALLWGRNAFAGMPSVTLPDIPRFVRGLTWTGLTDVARHRLDVISFFLLCLLLCAGAIRWAWNALRKDFPILPRLSYARALGVIVLWGLLFVLVLTMISGARELMTPGAWEKTGLTYRLAQPPSPPAQAEITARFDAIDRLGERLQSYAKDHDYSYPVPSRTDVIDAALWQLPSPPGGRYVYRGGILPNESNGVAPSVLAYEPESVGPDRLVLMSHGYIQWMPVSEIDRRLASEKK